MISNDTETVEPSTPVKSKIKRKDGANIEIDDNYSDKNLQIDNL